MTVRLPGPGPQLSTGRLRVDARRAIAKLREYQLADRTAWILEAIRAAVASGATDISLSGDANDIWLVWQGEPWPVEVLPRLFDELVSPATGEDVQHVRLLAAAVNSALGMNPAYVDVFAVAGDGTAQVARYTPDVLAEPKDELGDSPLEHVAARPTKPPEGATRGMAVHLRRRLSLDLIANWLGHPPELAVAEGACSYIAVPFHVRNRTYQRTAKHHDVLRVPLGEGVDGFVAVSGHTIESPKVIIAEHGVELARYEIALVDGDEGQQRVPLYVFIDAPHMPTNASRAQVLRYKHPISTGEAAAKKLVPEVIAKLTELAKQGNVAARDAALAWIGATIGGPHWHVQAAGIRGAVRELAKLQLVRNAVGELRPVAIHWGAQVHTGKAAYPMELAPWLSDILWVPPLDSSARLLAGAPADTRAMRRLVRWAKRQASAQRKFYAHAKREAKLVSVRQPRVRMRLGATVVDSAIDDKRFEGLSGEIAIYTDSFGGLLTVLLEGRELERVSIDCPIAFDAVIDSAKLKPADRYRGVTRDSEYNRVERAVFGALVRATEALALARNAHEVDAAIGPEAGKANDARLFRAGLGLLRDQHVKLKGPLQAAPLWETVDGNWVGPQQLAGAAIGVASRPGVIVPKGRIVLIASDDDRLLIGKGFGGRIINYDRTAERLAPDEVRLAVELGKGRPCALSIRDGDLIGAIAPASKSTIQLQHATVALTTQARKARYIDTAIVVSSDAIVPDTDWKTAYDDAGLLKRDYAAWELALVRSIARAVGGELRPELRVPGTLDIESPLGVALCEAIVGNKIEELLDLELVTTLRKAPILRVNDRRQRISINDFVTLHPTETQTVPVIPDHVELDGEFSPIVGPMVVAEAVAKILGRKVRDASGEVQRRQRRARFEQRYAEHCTKPEEPIALDTPERVPIQGAFARGFVGISDSDVGIRVFVENRWFQTIGAPDLLPIRAVVELAAEHCGETFNEIPEAAITKIQADVRRALPRVLAEVATNRPTALVQPGSARRVLAAMVEHLDDATRKAILEAPAFATLQGQPISIDTVAEPHRVVRVASWQDSWLGPDKGEPQTALDGAILAISDDDELKELCRKLSNLPVADVTDDVSRLQANRRMARGLLPTPKVSGVSADLKRKLSELGDAGKKLGHGEMALVNSDQSSLLLHSHGRFVRGVPIDVMPPISLAIEDQEIATGEPTDLQKLVDSFLEDDKHPVTKIAQDLAVELTTQVLGSPGGRSLLTPRMLKNIGHAVLARRLDPAVLGDLAVFETVDSKFVRWGALQEQVGLFGDVWAVSMRPVEPPLDDRRIVLYVSEAERTNKSPRIKLVSANKELELDGEARRNRDRPAVVSLALPSKHGVFGEADLNGDGLTAPRGTVAILLPGNAGWRGVDVYRQMKPLGRMPDPCSWPTVAVIDDARFAPDRTWSEPKTDHTWQAATKVVRTASEALLDTIGEPPADALVTLRIDASTSSDIKELRKHGKSQVRGLVWLVGAPRADRVTIQVTHALGAISYVPAHGIALGGQVLVYSDGHVDLEHALEQLAGHVHGRLVRQLYDKRENHDAEVVAAHVVKGLALETVRPTEVRGMTFSCFAPNPLEARAVVALLRRNEPVPVIQHDEPFAGEIALVDDGGPLAHVLLEELGKRARRYAQIVLPKPSPPQPVTVKLPGLPPERPTPSPTPAAAPPKKKKEPPPPHPLQGVIERVSTRVGELGLRGHAWTIVDDKQPMFRFEHGELLVAGDHPKLRAIATLPDDSPFCRAAIDVVAAHAVSVLNIALTEVTDATEVAALTALLATPPSAGRPRSRRSS